MSQSNFMRTAAGRRFQRDLLDLKKRGSLKKYLDSNKKFFLPGQFNEFVPVTKYKEQKHRPEDVGLAAGDLVYITKGENKGLVTRLLFYNKYLDTFVIEDGVQDVRIIPKYEWQEGQESHIQRLNKQYTPDYFKLCTKLKDDNKVYVANSIVTRGKEWDDRYNRRMPIRVVENHEHIVIPWPGPEPIKDDDLCTAEEHVLPNSYIVKSVAIPPFDPAVVKDIRNVKTKHQKRTITENDLRSIARPPMPLSEGKKALIEEKAAKKAKGFTDLTPDMAVFLGTKVANALNSIKNPLLAEHINEVSAVRNPSYESIKDELRAPFAEK